MEQEQVHRGGNSRGSKLPLDFSDDERGHAVFGSSIEFKSKKKRHKKSLGESEKRHRLAFESDSSDGSNSEALINLGTKRRKPGSKAGASDKALGGEDSVKHKKRIKAKDGSSKEAVVIDSDDEPIITLAREKKSCIQYSRRGAPRRIHGKDSPRATVSSGIKKNRRDLKPVLKVGDAVYAAWWPDPESRREHTCSSWYAGKVTSVKEVDRGGEYGPVRYYSIEYDDGDTLDLVEEIFVFHKVDYLLSTEKKKEWMGVKTMNDPKATDRWARDVGWCVASIDGREQPFSRMSDALRAYDASIVDQMGAKTKPCYLNLPNEWEFGNEFNDETISSMPKLRWIQFVKGSNKYVGRLNYGGKGYGLGCYKLASDAALAHDTALRMLKGSNATKVNFATDQEHATARAIELRRTGLDVNLEAVRAHISSKVNELISKVRVASPSHSLNRDEVVTKKQSVVPTMAPRVGKSGMVSPQTQSKKKQKSNNLRAPYLTREKTYSFYTMHGGTKVHLGSFSLKNDAAMPSEMVATVQDYERAKKLEVGRTGMAIDVTMSSAAIESQLNENLHQTFATGAEETVKTISGTMDGNLFAKETVSATLETCKVTSSSDRSHPTKASELDKNGMVLPKDDCKKKQHPKYPGVSYHVKNSKFVSCISRYGKQAYLGSYHLETDAAFSRDVAARILKIPNEKRNFSTLQDYGREKKHELARRGLSVNAGVCPALIERKVTEILRKIVATVDKSTVVPVSGTKKGECSVVITTSAPPETCPEIAALNNAAAKKWAAYLPSETGQDYLDLYKKGINQILQDLKPRASSEKVDAPTPSTVSTGHEFSSTGPSRKESRGKIIKSNCSETGKEAAAQKVDRTSTRGLNKLKDLIENSKESTEHEFTLKSGISLPIREKSNCHTPFTSTCNCTTLKKAKSAELAEKPNVPTKKRNKSAEDTLTQKSGRHSSLEKVTCEIPLSKSHNQVPFSSVNANTALLELTTNQMKEVSVRYPVGCSVWFRYNEVGKSDLRQSFHTGVVSAVFIDLSSREFAYRVGVSTAQGIEGSEMIPEHKLCYGPGCPVSISQFAPGTKETSSHHLQGEILMCRAKSPHHIKAQAVLELNEKARQFNMSGKCEKLKDILNQLASVEMDRLILADTLIGKYIVTLKTHDNTLVADQACELVKKWKRIANSEKGQDTGYAGSTFAYLYTILVIKEGNQIYVEHDVSPERVKYRVAPQVRAEENECCNSTITTATGI